MTSACAGTEPVAAAAAVTAREEEELFAAYSNWRRSVTCATSWAPGPIAGVDRAMAIADQALRRLQEAGHAELIARLDARYAEIDSRIDWVCGDDGLDPEQIAVQRRKGLETAGNRLAAVIDDAVR